MASKSEKAGFVGGEDISDFSDRVERQLARMASLSPGWDREEARPIDGAVIEAARGFLSRLGKHSPPVPDIVPLARGTLQLEWHDGPRSLELEFEGPEEIRYLKWHPEEGVEEEDSIAVGDDDQAMSLIRWFLGNERNA
jgi:hypothetical protein